MSPGIILPYYCVIGGWVIKYFIVFITGDVEAASNPDYFGNFIGETAEPIVYTAIFLLILAVIVFLGVDKGIEASSKILMPILFVLIVGIAVYCVTLKNTDAEGITRTGVEGLKILVVPNLEGVTVKSFFSVMLDAMGQMFYSLSVAMGIMVAYGSYVSDDTNLSGCINKIEICDTLVAFLAAVMIIPSVFVFQGTEGLEKSGPSLLFVSLPQVFLKMGKIGPILGCLFFAMVFFAALTSAVSILEAVVSSFMDEFKISRKRSTFTEVIICAVMAVVVCLGYNKLFFNITLPNGSSAQILDVMDYASNNVLMPVVSIATCILVGWVVKPGIIIEEMEKNGNKFGRKKLFVIMIKYVAPALLLILLLKSVGILKAI